jgi:serine/threonine-protein kinase
MIAVGTKLGNYEVTSHIGSGGMGEVYQAHDTKLGRDVAIKVLPEQFARDPERLARFQREAKLLAALNHPNIAAIYGLEESAGTNYLIMELVPGETLRNRILREGALPIEDALKIARQIAEALEAAHEKSIIHRDLKPANVKVTPEGRVKVLDFGLAKAFSSESSVEEIANSPTLSMAATVHGVILGTAAYMSPEQARGKSVTKATDIWAFGAVLYEMLSGKQAFQGEDVTDILAAVVRAEPDWTKLLADTPPSIKTLLRRCLRKDRNQRLQDAAGIRIEIEDALSAPMPTELTSVAISQPRWTWQILAVLVLGAIAIAAVTGLTVWNLKPTAAPPSRPVSRTIIDLSPGQHLSGLDTGPAVALSPDGTQLAYVAAQNGTEQLYLRPMDSLEAKPILGTDGAVQPFFSTDGQWLGFFAGGKLKKVSVSGGVPLTLGDAAQPRGASWNSLGMIAFAPTIVSALQQLPDAGGTPQALTHIEKGDTGYLWPEFLPGGRALLFAARAVDGAGIASLSIKTGERREVVRGASSPRYASSGHLVYAQAGTLMAVPFDPQRLTVTGAAIPMLEGILQSETTGAAQYSLSSTGSLVYISGAIQATQRRLVWVSRNGEEQTLAAPTRVYMNARVSPDGGRVAVAFQEQENQTWLYDLSRDTLTRLTFEGVLNSYPVWTPDGKRIAFMSNKEGPLNLFWQMADGSGGLERLTTSQYVQGPNSWSPDGQLLAFNEFSPVTGADIWVLRLSDHKAQPFLQTKANETSAQFSPDGRWMAYVSDESGRNEVYVQPYPGPGGKRQISTDGGGEPVWNPNGRELFYRNGDKMMAVDILTQSAFTAGKARLLFERQYVPASFAAPYRNYDVSPDGQRFLMVKANEQTDAAPTQINVVQNWFEELKRRVPTGTK